jgi:hypothetical protein
MACALIAPSLKLLLAIILFEELEAQASEIVQRQADHRREYHERTKMEDPEKHRGSVKAARQRSFAKCVNEKRHYCAICDNAFGKMANLTRHLKGTKHGANGRAVKGGKYHCGICDHAFANLTRHLNQPKHAAMAARNLDCQ